MQGVEDNFELWTGDTVWMCAKTMTQDQQGITYDNQALALIYFSGHAGIMRE